MAGYFSKKTIHETFRHQESDLCINVWYMICIENDFKENTKSGYLWDGVIGHFSKYCGATWWICVFDMMLLLLLSRSVVSNSVWPHTGQPTRLPHPWDSPGKNTGVGCHFLLQCMKVKSESEVTQSCPTLSDPMDCSPPGSSVHGIFQARVLEWGATAFIKWW